MELRQLRYFVAIIDHGSLSRAALVLHVAQPALTQQLRQLENELGVQLLHRSAQGVLSTDAGKVFYQHALAILKQVADAQAAVIQSAERPSGSVYKDEYEVARLYTDGRFVEQLKTQFEGDFSLKFNLAPPLFAKKDARGHLVKAEFGAWMWTAFKLLAKLKGLRGGAFDVFGYSAERKMERALIAEYRATVEVLMATLDGSNHAQAVELASLPEQIRGFGHVKEQAVAEYRARKDALLSGSVARRAA